MAAFGGNGFHAIGHTAMLTIFLRHPEYIMSCCAVVVAVRGDAILRNVPDVAVAGAAAEACMPHADV